SIGTALGASVTDLQWTVDAYVVVLAGFMLFFGSVADRIGRRRVFLTGLALFALGSLLCSVSPTLEWLVASRMVQAFGGSMLNPVAMSIITNVFTEPRERARAIGLWGSAFGLAVALGPLLGGVLVQFAGWRAIFFVNIPVVAATFVAASIFISESR